MDSARPSVDAGEEYLVVGGQELRLTNPVRVLYPATGTTKADVIAYYAAVAGVMLPHLAGRPATRKRWPDGVTGEAFFVQEIEAGIPVWLSRGCRSRSIGQRRLPGAGLPGRVGLAECVQVALALRERLGALGSRMVPVTSGSKGLHLYVPMDQPITSEQASDWARLVAEELEKALPTLVVSTMARSARRGKVLIDWSQNNGSKTTIVVDARLTDHQKASVIAHELGHVYTGHVDSSPQEYRRHRGQSQLFIEQITGRQVAAVLRGRPRRAGGGHLGRRRWIGFQGLRSPVSSPGLWWRH